MTAPLDLLGVEAETGIRKATVEHWLWRFRRGLHLSPEAKAFCRLVRKIGGRIRVDQGELRAWVRSCAPGAVRNLNPPESEAQLAERIAEVAALARDVGLDCCADALALAGRLASEGGQG